MVAKARIVRRRRLRAIKFGSSEGGSAPGEVAVRRRRAAVLVERMLCGPLPAQVDCAQFLQVLAGRHQMASAIIGTMMVSVERVMLNAVQARAIAVALTDLVHFVEAGAARGEQVGIYLAVAVDDDRLIVGLGAEGEIGPVSSLTATSSLLRAGAIVRMLSGDFQRGIDNGRMVFGLTFPRILVEDVAS